MVVGDTSSSEPETTLLDALECDLVATPAIPAETAVEDRFEHCAEFDMTRGDSDDEPLIPSTVGAVPPFPTWVDEPDNQFPHSASRSQSLRTGVRNVPRMPACPDRDVPASAQIVDSSEIADMPVTMVDSDSHVLCQVVGRNQPSRRLVLCGDRGRTQESVEAETVQDLETTPEDEAGSREEEHPRHTQVDEEADTDSVASVATVVAEAIPHDPAEKDDRESSVWGDVESADDEEEEIPFRHPGVRSCQWGFRSLDVVQLCDVFERRGCLMQSVPRFLKGPFRRALRVALEEILRGARTNDSTTEERGWKLLLLLPRMLLHRPGRGGLISKPKLARFETFVRGEWQAFIEAGQECASKAAAAKSRRRRTERGLKHRISRAEALVHLGELSAARQALEGAEVVPGSIETLNELRKRPSVPREVCPPELIRHRPAVLFALDDDNLSKNLRSAKRGAAGGPSGMTVEHLQPLLDHPKDLRLFVQVPERLARGQVPERIQAALRMGRLTALRKADGKIRGIVAGDVVRRLVARTMSQQLMDTVQQATAPFQCAMATKAGCECISHVLQALTELNPSATILSVDGMSAHDMRSRKAMLQGLSNVEGGRAALPFVSMFCGAPSQYLWEDDSGTVHTIDQGEGGEQGDAMMPLLHSLGQHGALQKLQSELHDGETLLAFSDDTYVVIPSPGKTTAVYAALQEAMLSSTGIRINPGKTKVWNAAGVKPAGCGVLQRIAETHDPAAVVWRGSELPTCRQGLNVLGTPLGHPDFVRTSLEMKNIGHQRFLDRIPLLEDVQASWLLLVHCAAARANYMTRVVEPGATRDFSERNDEALWQSLCQIMQMSPTQAEDIRLTASLPMVLGRLGLRSATRVRQAAYWSSWAACIPMVHQRHPGVAAAIVAHLSGNPETRFLS